MTDDKQVLFSEKRTKVSSNDITVPDATNPRFRKPMCRCSDEMHGTFPLNSLHEHFSKLKHKSVTSCSYCGANEVYEYYFTMDRYKVKIYHDCSRQEASTTTATVQEQERSNNQPISHCFETSYTDSSGFGTGCSSIVSICNGQSDDGQSTSSSLTKSSPVLSYSESMPSENLNGSQSKRN